MTGRNTSILWKKFHIQSYRRRALVLQPVWNTVLSVKCALLQAQTISTNVFKCLRASSVSAYRCKIKRVSQLVPIIIILKKILFKNCYYCGLHRERFSVEWTERLIVTTTECVHSSHYTLESVTPTYSYSTRYSDTGPLLCSERSMIINII